MAIHETQHSSAFAIPTNISDAAKLTQFRQKRAEWFELFESDKTEVISIQRQLLDAIVLDLNYRVFIQESARHKNGEGYAIPSLLHLLNVGYVTSQVLVARRFLDPRKDVASIARILKEIRKSRKLITRENFVCYDGTVYESDVHQAIQNDEQNREFAIFGLQGPSFSSHLRSYDRHQRFDMLSKTNESCRKKTDVIHENVFTTVERWLKSTEALKLKQISDDRFAHASDGSHSEFKNTAYDLVQIEVEVALKGFVRSSRAIFDVILDSRNYSEVVPMIPLGSFGTVWSGEDLIKATSRMQKDWDDFVEKRNSWANGVEEALFLESFAPEWQTAI